MYLEDFSQDLLTLLKGFSKNACSKEQYRRDCLAIWGESCGDDENNSGGVKENLMMFSVEFHYNEGFILINHCRNKEEEEEEEEEAGARKIMKIE